MSWKKKLLRKVVCAASTNLLFMLDTFKFKWFQILLSNHQHRMRTNYSCSFVFNWPISFLTLSASLFFFKQMTPNLTSFKAWLCHWKIHYSSKPPRCVKENLVVLFEVYLNHGQDLLWMHALLSLPLIEEHFWLRCLLGLNFMEALGSYSWH